MEIKPEHLPEVIAGALALYECTGGALAAHVPLPAFRNKLRSPYKDKAKTIMEKRLKRYNFAYQKGGTNSWAITRDCLNFLRERGLISP